MSLNGWNQTEVSRQLGFRTHTHISAVMNDKGNLGGSSWKLAGTRHPEPKAETRDPFSVPIATHHMGIVK